MAEKMVKVYGLRAPAVSEEIRYVGITTQDPKRRLAQHWTRVRRNAERTHKAAWMRKMDALGHSVEIVVLNEVRESEWQDAERRYIAQFPNLTNSTAGGEGLLDPTPETRERMRQAQLGKKRDQEVVEKVRKALIGNKNGLGWRPTPEQTAKAVAARAGKSGKYERTSESIEKMRSKKVGKKASAETRLKMSATHRERLKDPAEIEKIRRVHLGSKRSPETCERMRQAALGRTFSDETLARMREAARLRWERTRTNATEPQHV